MKNYYQVLGVDPLASESEIRSSYLQLAKRFHPDKNHDPSAKAYFLEIQEAYECLSDTQKRASFDAVRAYVNENSRSRAEAERRERIYNSWVAHQQRMGKRRDINQIIRKHKEQYHSPKWFTRMNLVYNLIFMLVFLLVLSAPIYSYVKELELPLARRKPLIHFIVPSIMGAVLTSFGYYYWYILKTDRLK
ncbi:MAG: J domain-containing protein [Flavobacteriales bacterium]